MKKYSAGEWQWKELQAKMLIAVVLTVILLWGGVKHWYLLVLFWVIMIPLARSIYNSRHKY